MHDATKVLMGSTQSSDRDASVFPSDPASFPAGRAVRLADDGTLSTTLADGGLVGVSLGRSLSDTKKTAVCRDGNRVPIELAKYLVKAQLTFTLKRKVAVAIELLDTETAGAETVTVTGDDDAGYLISVGMDSTTSTTTQIKAALDGEPDALALIETKIASGQGATAVTAFASDDIDTMAQAVIGAVVRVSDVTGKAVPAGIGSATGACYASGALTGIQEDATEIDVAVIDMAGGL
jgi:hypothetical protein